MHGINFTQCIKRVFCCILSPSHWICILLYTLHALLNRTVLYLNLQTTPSTPLLFAGLYGLRSSVCIGKLSVFISVHQFEEICSALIDSAVDCQTSFVQKIIFLFVCETPQQEAQADTGIQMGANADRGPLCLLAWKNRACWHCRYRRGGTITQGCRHKLHSSTLSIASQDLSQQAHPTNIPLPPFSISLAFSAS